MAGSSSIGSDIFAVLSLLVVSTLVLLLIRHYLPLRLTPGYLLLPVFLALALPCSIILLVPIDLASATDSDDNPSRGVWLPERVVLVTWRITYWLTFVLTWFILPLLGEYTDSGYRDTRQRVLDSVRSNARYQLITLGAGILGLVYFVFQNGFDGQSIKGMVMALAYTWGLILAIGLMGHGMVALPRRLFKNANVSARLRNLQTQAPKVKDKLDEAADDLDELEHLVSQLKQRKHGNGRAMQEWIDDLDETSPVSESRPGATAAIWSMNVAIPAVLTERYLADVTRKLKRARHKKARFMDEWSSLCQRAEEAQKILDAATSKKLDSLDEIPARRGLLGRLTFLTPTTRFHLYMNVVPALRILFSLIFALASIMVVWSEVIKPFNENISVIGLTVVHHPKSESGKVGFGGQIIAAFWLLYMDACALYAIQDVKVWGNRALVKRQTYAESACWYSLQVSKLTVPLSYNFITMLPWDVYKETSFFQFLGQLIVLTPLGKGFSRYFPCFILISVLASAFNIYGRMKNIIGFGVLEDDDETNAAGFGTGGWREGRALIDRELQSRGASGTVGLVSRGASLDAERVAPPIASASSRPLDRTPLVPAQSTRQPTQQPRAIPSQAHDPPGAGNDDDDSPRAFYQDFGERVRNTFENVDRPDWMKNMTFSPPKWMKKDQDDASGGGNAISRWFGGRAEDGRVRL
nr:limr family protein [Quercus suber]